MMRLGISLQEGYLIILATLIVLQGAGTIYGLWAQGRAATPEAVRRLAVANSRVRMGWWLIIVFTVAWWWAWPRWSCSLRFSPSSCCENSSR